MSGYLSHFSCSPSYPATNTFGSSADSSTASQFAGYETPEYKEVYTAAAAANKHPAAAAGGANMSHIPVTSSNEYSKMMGAEKNVFNMGYMQFPNYIQHMQQVTQVCYMFASLFCRHLKIKWAY